jgi:hypothetical protein
MRTRLFGVLAAAVAPSQTPAAQPPPTGSRVPPGHMITGTGPNGRPVRHALVTLLGGSSAPRSASTDGTGQYRVDMLTPGDHTIAVPKAAVVRFDGAPGGDIVLVRGAAIEETAHANPRAYGFGSSKVKRPSVEARQEIPCDPPSVNVSTKLSCI